MLQRYPDANIYVLDISSLDPDQDRWKPWLGPERIAALSRLRKKQDRSRCAGAGLLLAYVIKKHAPGLGVPPLTVTGSNGKPYLPQLPELQFNISHSGKWVVCGAGDKPLGLDIEKVQRDITAVARRYYPQRELDWLQTLPPNRRQAALIQGWVLRESCMKATGLGLRLPLKDLEIVFNPEVQVYLTRKGVKTHCASTLCAFDDQEYRLALTVMDASPPPPASMPTTTSAASPCLKPCAWTAPVLAWMK
ncbi:4'-phosphopantetheinyl transferase superfamily protein [Desulfonatronospira sp.]|uniref:4'-phosphopantetheinyl transferase family protein n=1 Tax=Desulfonatronospira sp. TaxID=1962951 RepID=UPI0025BD7055|nr:4'-phosphopantetheinyl transferase superfamily protein [Desulfonatronospira sp.]